MENERIFEELENEVLRINREQEKSAHNSAWSKGVSVYTEELLENIRDYKNKIENNQELRSAALNGDESWCGYSWGGSSLIYDGDICKNLCCPSEQKKKDFGRLAPNMHESWLDVQARALAQAFSRIKRAFCIIDENNQGE